MAGQERSQSAGADDSAYRADDSKYSQRLFDRQATAAFVSYLALSVLIFGRGVLAHPATVYIGQGPDPQVYIWFLAWWAHAISHHLNPFLPMVVWAPSGGNLAWACDFPLAACVLYPVTRLWGPIVSANVLHLVAPPLAGWSTFVLCRYLVKRYWPAWLGGCIFAFSPFMLASMADGVLFVLFFPVPLAVWATLRHLAHELKARIFLLTMVLLLVAQFLLSVEILASASLFGVVAVWLTARWSSTDEYTRLRSAAWLIVFAYAISALILSPYLYYMLAFERPPAFIFPPWRESIDLVNFIVPTSLNQLGNISLFQTIAHRFLATLYDSGGYMGLPLLTIVTLFARERWHDRTSRFMVCMFASACVLAMGPFLEVLGYRLLPLPGAALDGLPLIDKAQPGRLMPYAYLASAVIVAMWLAEKGARKELRWALGLAIVPFMLPNLSASFWTTPAEVPVFFSSGLYSKYIVPKQNVMILPYGYLGEGMLWQAVTDMYFRMAGGYLSAVPPVPEEHRRWPIMTGLYKDVGVPEAGDQLKAYLANHDVGAIIVGPNSYYLVLRMGSQPTPAILVRWPTIERERTATRKLLSSLDTQPLDIGGITLYRVASSTIAPYRRFTALEMQRRAIRARFEALLLCAERYLAQGRDPGSLSPQLAQKLGLLPTDWFGGTLFNDTGFDPVFHSSVLLRPSNAGGIMIGVEGSYDALKPTVETYGADAMQTYFPYPTPLSTASIPHDPAMMAMTFDRAGLEHAVAAAMRRQKTNLHPTASSRAAG